MNRQFIAVLHNFNGGWYHVSENLHEVAEQVVECGAEWRKGRGEFAQGSTHEVNVWDITDIPNWKIEWDGSLVDMDTDQNLMDKVIVVRQKVKKDYTDC